MSLKTKKLLLASSVVILLGGCNSDSGSNNYISMDLRLMETTDIHTNVMPYNYFVNADVNANSMPEWGLARTSLVIQETREEVDNSMLFDNGDLVQGSPMGDYMANLGVEHLKRDLHPVYKAMNHLKYDAANLGNHEFNYGLEYLEEALKGSDFPYVSANIWKADDSLEKVSTDAEECEIQITEDFYEQAESMHSPYVILDRDFLGDDGQYHTVKVGVIGFTPPQIMGWDSSHLKCNVLVSDIKKTAEHYVPMMKAEGADVIVAIPHSGLADEDGEFAENATLQLAYVDDVDAIMFGHDHREFPNSTGEYSEIEGVKSEKGLINGIPAVMPGFWGAKLGVIDIKLNSKDGGETWHVDHSQSTAKLRSLLPEQSDTVIEALVAEEHKGTVEYMADTIAEIDVNVNSFFPQLVPDLSIQIVNEAQLHQLMKWKDEGQFPDASADAFFLSVSAPFKSGRNGGEDFTNIQDGEFTNASVADIYVFDNNTPAVLKMTGADMKRWIEWVNSNAYNNLPLQDGETFLVEGFPGYNFDAFYGGVDNGGEGLLKYEVNVVNKPRFTNINGFNYDETASNQQLTSLTFKGEEIDDDAEIYVITNNYRASNVDMPGIDKAELIKEEAAFNNRNLVQYYLNDRLEEQDDDLKLEFKNAEVFTLVAPGTDKVTFASAKLEEAYRCADELTGLSTTGVETTKEGSEGFVEYYFDFDYSGEFNCSFKGH
ncbi:bifunctional 2',3'-cyclic-nucleotide 2'-phosphodiesterase/3'-nucleotidase [Photobacterium sp. ZSDE20]|uniref:Bifunctional 2',3'-cyclic-nucleotide 2'-phosphodiesterase/3'-nucleotidase n=1 Tax=Photobacterium pectinilyticum TaxID=2906793 RepID=A0ABT1N487_9GAMM|nr:bifunctional 2',3'-cyclic-nucleotide 2'-phosphodiesterase/3'-nucleotidase [Photobacterium sp. ZSDE20]MCQ1058679.1 bifunctional 2',3'-cyclic-nucleotide 2'-phosphodiesterase/3'-nucleotidase [Photobacterium sp. ZSDE20]MDD1823393.1 bifunctional 2',3'-cyclic-nucleotide 2'-phosphodiesterase/3'-nucleotidase [Photobacterium sp. ZSDE20]